MMELHGQSRPEISGQPHSVASTRLFPLPRLPVSLLRALRTLTLHARPAAIYEIVAIFRDYTTKDPLLVYAVISRHGASRLH